MNQPSLWKGKRVLVTGADGFVGSHLVERLVSEVAVVKAFVRGTSTTGTGGYQLKNLTPEIQEQLEEIICGDISSPDAISLILRSEPQIIFHLAASAYISYAMDHPLEMININVVGTLYVLEAARNMKGLERVVCTSSSAIYGVALTDEISEDHPINPACPYGA